jgi:tripartite-type tricarboxylate transporter receptor subunit TctC
MATQRRTLLLGAAAGSLLGRPAWAQAEAWPVRQARFVIPFAPGGGQDVFWRILADRLGRQLRTTFFVENKGGAGSSLGAHEVVRAAPDGGTFLTTTSSIAILPALYANLPFDPERDLTPITTLCEVGSAILVRTESPLRSLADLIARAKAEPGKPTFGSGGVGSSNHLVGSLFASQAGIEVTHVPYRGVGPAMTAVYAGEIDFAVSSMLELLGHVRQGRVRLLGITNTQRLPEIPDVPTIAETLPGFSASSWFGMFGPRGLPPALVARLTPELDALREDAELKARLAQSAAVMLLDGPARLAARMSEDVAKWKSVVARAGIRAE